MIAYLEGKIIHRGANYLIVKADHLGFKVFVDEKTRSIDKDKIELFIYNHVREDLNDLFGFQKVSDLEIFEMLLQVSGVGPKVALSIVSALGKEKIIAAIANNDSTQFKSIPGIGSKVALKIIVELKNKISKGEFGDSFLTDEDETVEALVSLGLKKQEILPVLRESPAGLSTQEKVKFVLKNAHKK